MNNIIKKIKNDKIINLITKYVENNAPNAEIYVVGGIIRDYYLNKENFDKDIIIHNINVREFAQSFAKSIKATFINLDDVNNIYRLVLKDKVNYIDIADLIGEKIEDDLNRRDLTINSIAVNLRTFEVLDISGGIQDLKSKKIRHISEQNFIDDPLRLLRVYRFKSMLGFDLDNELTKIVKKHVQKIHMSAIERIDYEFLKLFSGNYSSQALIDMDNVGLLEEILPISSALKKVPPNSHHHLNLFNHSIEVVKQIQKIYEKSGTDVKMHLEKLDFGGFSRLTSLKFAGFLHDIGKPETWTIEKNTGRHRFIKHDDIGSKIGAKILRTDKFSKKQIDYISKMIKYHIYPSHVVSAPELNDKTYMRFIRKMDDNVIDIIILAMADRLAARGPEITANIVKENIDKLNALLNFYLKIKDSLEPLPKLLSGEDIMKLLNIKPSKELGIVVNSLKEAQLAGDITTKEDAINFIKSL